MKYIAHRINTLEMLTKTPKEYGVELDLRDHGSELILQHDPFAGDAAESFAPYLANYAHGLMILNIKSERIEWRVLEMIQQSAVQDYFFLDSSFPMIRSLIRAGEHRIAVRFSEYEPVESALSLAGQVDWVWVDCFNQMPLDDTTYGLLKPHFKLCIVSPELQGRSVDTIPDFAATLAPYEVDAICTKRPDLWKHALSLASAHPN